MQMIADMEIDQYLAGQPIQSIYDLELGQRVSAGWCSGVVVGWEGIVDNKFGVVPEPVLDGSNCRLAIRLESVDNSTFKVGQTIYFFKSMVDKLRLI